jgi:hypothetical protein
MTDDMAPGAPLYTVTSQVETYDRNDAGTFVLGVQVSFRTRSGASGSAFVPYAELTADRVAQLIGQRARVMEQVAGLGGEG